jgi:GNAT superfamily N-acetyltransferase
MSPKVTIKRTLSAKTEFAMEARCSRKLKGKSEPCGSINAEYYIPSNGEPDTGPFWSIVNVEVNPAMQRQGIATRLYEAAAKEACRRDATPIGSNIRTLASPSNQFWAKQFAKGRAVRYSHMRWHGEYGELFIDHPTYVLRHCGITALDGTRSPKRSGRRANARNRRR